MILPPEIKTLIDLLRYRSEQHGEQKVISFLRYDGTEEQALSFAALDIKARAVATLLKEQGIAIGERAMLLYQPSIDYIVAFFGCLYAGVTPIPVFAPRLNQSIERIRNIQRDANAAVMLTTGSVLANLDTFDGMQNDNALLWLATDEIEAALANDWKAPNIRANSLAFLQYTSGSTANPKGVMLSHENLLYNSELIHKAVDTSPDSRIVIWLPPFHDMGLIGGVLQPVYVGCYVALMSPASFLRRPLSWLKAITQERATISGGPNFAYELCLRRIKPAQRDELDLSEWRVAFNGAEPVRASTMARFSQYFAICGFKKSSFFPCYGLAESTVFVSGGGNSKNVEQLVLSINKQFLEKNVVKLEDEQDKSQMLVSSGKVANDLDVLIVNPETQNRCEPGEIGEIWISGSSVAQGYWQRQEETAMTFQAYLTTGEGPYLRTGDLGFLHNEELFITGRIKDLIVIRGNNHYPQDIEQTVTESHPTLHGENGCAAFSIDVENEEQLIIVQEISRRYRDTDFNELEVVVRDAISRHHQLNAYQIIFIQQGGIPKTSSGKIQRYRCREQLLTGNLSKIGEL